MDLFIATLITQYARYAVRKTAARRPARPDRDARALAFLLQRPGRL
jgi:hypothetical protein